MHNAIAETTRNPEQASDLPIGGLLIFQPGQLDHFNAWENSATFFNSYADLFPEGYGQVLQAGVIDAEAQPIDINTTYPEILSVLFDARDRDKGRYTWQAVLTDIEASPSYRDVVTREVFKDKDNLQQNQRFDAGGRLMEYTKPQDILRRLARLSFSSQISLDFIDTTKKLRQVRLAYQQKMVELDLEVDFKESEFYTNKMKKLREGADRVGFPALSPQIYSQFTQPHYSAFK